MPIDNTSLAMPVQAAMVTTIKADGPLNALLAGDKVYDGVAPVLDVPGTVGGAGDRPQPHIVLGTSTQTVAHRFRRAANEHTLAFDLIGDDIGSRADVAAIEARLRALFDDKPFAVTGGFVEQGRFFTAFCIPDPSRAGYRTLLIYNYRVRGA